MTRTPEQRLASRIVERHDLTPPIDIAALTKQYAALEFAEWPYECDGLTIGLTSLPRPRVFIRHTGNTLRQRFTMAHELGHVLLPWHIEEVACSPRVGSGAFFEGGLREREASTFASHLLVPDRFLEPLCAVEISMTDALKALEKAEVSASASLIALARALPPGVAFVVEDRIFSSRGTVLPATNFDYWRNRQAWNSAAASHGRTRLRGKSLRWFKFEQFEEPAKVSDPRDSTQLLRDAIACITDDPREQKRILNVVNGVIGAAMTDENRSSPARALATMRHRLRARADLAELLQEPDFDLFLRRRAFAHSNH
ncbi:ImmA/IrrE family metallo-endopeptidase [Micromonospora sp. NPDC049891]|uniref:ImmA/IrrE family metallo-endopeptidase n=1 Tax=Micromonospora sp. NPDC049891 TaxID=3155655 RepID=UPI0033EA81D0